VRGFRFSLAALIVCVLIPGIVFGIWRYDPQDGTAAATMIAIFVITAVNLAGLIGPKRTRSTCLAFAACAWPYLFLAVRPWVNNLPGAKIANFVVERRPLFDVEAIRVSIESVFALLVGFVGSVVYATLQSLIAPDAKPPGPSAANSRRQDFHPK